MRSIVLAMIKLYQILISPLWALFTTSGCRFWPSCSQFTYESVKKYGAMKGAKAGFLRILKCNPWS